jgi:hypothetical protein
MLRPDTQGFSGFEEGKLSRTTIDIGKLGIPSALP